MMNKRILRSCSCQHWECSWYCWRIGSPAWSSFPRPGRLSPAEQRSPAEEFRFWCSSWSKWWRSSRWPRWCLFKDRKKRMCVYSCPTGCFVKPIPISSGKPTPTLRLPRLSNRKHISICSDWFWPARLGPRHGHPLGWALFWLTLRFLAASRS